MKQLVGSSCVICRKRIGSVLDGHFCPHCQNAVHDACARPRDVEGGDQVCPQCGVDLLQAEAVGSDDAVGASRAVTRPKGPYPVSAVCPQCGHAGYKKRRPESWVAFAWDRVCTSCNTRYRPPTPWWAGGVFILAGLLLGGFGLVSVVGHLLSGNPLGIPAMACEGFLGFLGLLAVMHGIRSLVQQGKV